MKVIVIITLVLYMLLNMHTNVAAMHKQPKANLKVYILNTITVPLLDDTRAAFQQELQSLLPDSHVTFVIDNANGDRATAEKLIQKRISANQSFDLMVGIATVATKAMIATAHLHNNPMQFMIVSDPVDANIVPQMNTTSTVNITGESHVIDDATKLNMLQSVLETSQVGAPTRIGLLHSNYPSSLAGASSLIEKAKAYNTFEFVPLAYDFASGEDAIEINRKRIIKRLTDASETIDAYWIPPSPAAHDLTLYDSIQRQLDIPQIFSEDKSIVEKGALFGVMGNPSIFSRSAAKISYRILQGTPANAIAVSRLNVFLVAVNVNTAVNMNLVIPSSVLSVANNNVFQ